MADQHESASIKEKALQNELDTIKLQLKKRESEHAAERMSFEEDKSHLQVTLTRAPIPRGSHNVDLKIKLVAGPTGAIRGGSRGDKSQHMRPHRNHNPSFDPHCDFDPGA